MRGVLRRNGIAFWIDREAISINDSPEVTVVNLGYNEDAQRVQRLLDAVR